MSVMTPSVVPSASSVASSGSPAATSDPNVISRTIAAAMIPKNSDGPWLLLKRTISAPGPPCSTCSAALRAENAAFSTPSSVFGLMSFVLFL